MHVCDISKTERAVYEVGITLWRLDGNGRRIEPAEHNFTLDAGPSAADAVAHGDLYGLGQLVPDDERRRTAARDA